MKFQITQIFSSIVLIVFAVAIIFMGRITIEMNDQQRTGCQQTCKLEIVESIPEELKLHKLPFLKSTFDTWMRLIIESDKELLIAAYKTSLRNRNPLIDEVHSIEGSLIYNALLESGSIKGKSIRIVENQYLNNFKDTNYDGLSLAKKSATIKRLKFAEKPKLMHSKFIIRDKKDFYLGSANLDWRSLNQKVEIGVYVTNCSCLAEDLSRIFDAYWEISSIDEGKRSEESFTANSEYNEDRPLEIISDGVLTKIYLASSPRAMNGNNRSWDLKSIIKTIEEAKTFLYIHVMDYLPVYAYEKPQRLWLVIDNAIRKVIDRGVKVKLLTAAVHFPSFSMPYLMSLQDLKSFKKHLNVEVRIFDIPKSNITERRTHSKFVITDDTVIIGTSNWAAEYFEGETTGIAFVAKQTSEYRPLVNKMKKVFLRDWLSEYAQPLNQFIKQCSKDVFNKVIDEFKN